MGYGPFKVTGFKQGVYEASATRNEVLGTLRITADGRKWRYAKAGTSALHAGYMGQAASIGAAHSNETTVSGALGAYKVVGTITAGTAIGDDDLKGGYLIIQDDTGEGYAYPIAGNTAITAAGTYMVIDLEVPLKAALTTSTNITLCHSPWLKVTESATQELFPAGIAPIAVPANNYYWCQTGGLACVLGTSGIEAVATMMVQAATAGALSGLSGGAGTTVDVDQPIVAIVCGTAMVEDEFTPVWLQID